MKSCQRTSVFSCLVLLLLIEYGESNRITLGDKTYLVKLEKMSWFAAKNFCSSKGMHLLTLESSKERDLLLLYLLYKGQENHYYWTSGNDHAEKGKFVWTSTGQPFGFQDWNPGEPNNYDKEERCVQTWLGTLKLNNVMCKDGNTDLICETKKEMQ